VAAAYRLFGQDPYFLEEGVAASSTPNAQGVARLRRALQQDVESAGRKSAKRAFGKVWSLSLDIPRDAFSTSWFSRRAISKRRASSRRWPSASTPRVTPSCSTTPRSSMGRAPLRLHRGGLRQSATYEREPYKGPHTSVALEQGRSYRDVDITVRINREIALRKSMAGTWRSARSTTASPCAAGSTRTRTSAASAKSRAPRPSLKWWTTRSRWEAGSGKLAGWLERYFGATANRRSCSHNASPERRVQIEERACDPMDAPVFVLASPRPAHGRAMGAMGILGLALLLGPAARRKPSWARRRLRGHGRLDVTINGTTTITGNLGAANIAGSGPAASLARRSSPSPRRIKPISRGHSTAWPP